MSSESRHKLLIRHTQKKSKKQHQSCTMASLSSLLPSKQLPFHSAKKSYNFRARHFASQFYKIKCSFIICAHIFHLFIFISSMYTNLHWRETKITLQLQNGEDHAKKVTFRVKEKNPTNIWIKMSWEPERHLRGRVHMAPSLACVGHTLHSSNFFVDGGIFVFKDTISIYNTTHRHQHPCVIDVEWLLWSRSHVNRCLAVDALCLFGEDSYFWIAIHIHMPLIIIMMMDGY